MGFRQFQDALARFEHSSAVVVRHHAFELDAHAPLVYPGSLDEMLAAKYAVTVAQASELNGRVRDTARQLGMTWSLDLVRPANTFDAHRVIAHAATQQRQDAMIERLFRAYFSDGYLISDRETLSTIALEAGVVETDRMLASNEFVEVVRHDEHLASKIGITGVPAYIFDGHLFVSGAQGSDAMLDAMHTAWAERGEQSA
ncbi:MAG: DsbA family oxidoreductase [Actinomycetota bacterium]|nr:DsbA family oxidoreductase [Actinomycetota bacterium]